MIDFSWPELWSGIQEGFRGGLKAYFQPVIWIFTHRRHEIASGAIRYALQWISENNLTMPISTSVDSCIKEYFDE